MSRSTILYGGGPAHPNLFYSGVTTVGKAAVALAGGLATKFGIGKYNTIVQGDMGNVAQEWSKPKFRHEGFSQTKMQLKRVGPKRYKKQKVATVAAVRRMIVGNLEKKQLLKTPTASAIAQDAICTFNITAQIAQGTADGNRVGDVIALERLVANVRWYTDSEAAFYQLRVLVFWSGEEHNPGTTNFSTSGFSYNQIFVGAPLNNTGGVTNPKAVQVLYDNLVEINSNINGYEDGKTTRIDLRLPKGKFAYQEGGSIYGKLKNLYMVVIGNWSSTNADLPESTGTVQANVVVTYTDA